MRARSPLTPCPGGAPMASIRRHGNAVANVHQCRAAKEQYSARRSAHGQELVLIMPHDEMIIGNDVVAKPRKKPPMPPHCTTIATLGKDTGFQGMSQRVGATQRQKKSQRPRAKRGTILQLPHLTQCGRKTCLRGQRCRIVKEVLRLTSGYL